jgi:hypothetical protein
VPVPFMLGLAPGLGPLALCLTLCLVPLALCLALCLVPAYYNIIENQLKKRAG